MPLAHRERHQFKDAADVELHLIEALCARDWEWVAEVKEDAEMLYGDVFVKLERKYGLNDRVIAVSRSLAEGTYDARVDVDAPIYLPALAPA